MKVDKFFELSQDLLCIAGTDAYFKTINKRWSEVLGYTDKELLSKPFTSFIHPEDLERTFREVDKLSQGHPTVHFDNRYRKKDGEYIWLSWTSTPDPETGFFYASARDITKEKRDEILLNDTERVAKIGGWELNVAENRTYWTKGVFGIYGIDVPVDNMVSVDVGLEAYYPDDRDKISEAVNSAISDGTPWDLKLRFIKPNGGVIWVRAIGEAVANSAGEVTHLRGVFHDINAEMIQENKIHELNRRFTSALENTNNALVEWPDVAEDDVWISETFLDILGYTPTDLMNSNSALIDLIHPDDIEKTTEILDDAIFNLKPFDLVHRMRSKSSGYKWIRVKAAAYEDERSGKIAMIGIFSDITKIKNYELSLKQSNKELEQFAYVASHDLKEPLKMINLFSDRLLATEQDKLSKEGVDYISKLRDSVKSMSLLINDLLLYSKLINKRTRFSKVDLGKMLASASDSLETKLSDINANVSSDKLPTINGIKINWVQVFQNLFSNSIKFRKKEGKLKIDVKYEPYKNGIHKITFTDNGIGFDQNFSEKIFTPFKRLNPRGEYEGTGIGLAIVSKIISNHGGEIIAKSELGHGATFEMFLPMNFGQ